MDTSSWKGRLRQTFSYCTPWIPGTIAAIISIGIWQVGGWKALERQAYNTVFKARPQLEWDRRIVTIAIDRPSLEQYGQFPWSRDRYIKLLQALQKSPPAVIGFDIIFAAPSPQDPALAKAITASGNVVLSMSWDKSGQVLPPVPQLDRAAAHVGHIYNRRDFDGISRTATVQVESTPLLGLAMLEVFDRQRPWLDAVQLHTTPLDSQFKNLWINWPGRTKRVPTYSFVDVVEGRVNPQVFANKLVLVGVDATGIDPLSTPFDQIPPTSGMYLHAAVIDNLLNQRVLKTIPSQKILLLLVAIALGTNALLGSCQLKARIIIGLILPPAWGTIALIAFGWGHIWLPIAAPIGTILLTGLVIQLREQYEKQQLMQLFAQQVAPQTAELIWQHKEEILEDGQIEPRELTATVLFMDIRGFTTISEGLSPRELLEWLNLYLDTMSGCIMEHHGSIDKYIGDAIMAVFGLPSANGEEIDIQAEALNAIAASIAMHEQLQPLNERLQAEGKPLITVGIGIHTGLLVAGTVGSAQRFNYSVLGDTVNVAARLEAMNKQVEFDRPYNILVSGSTLDYVGDRYLAKEVGSIQLRGKKEQTNVYTIFGEQLSIAVESTNDESQKKLDIV
jgi:CHASE2 domain-containing sensor protein/class 3 adenylate cyclase